jgi:hypothetical protein
MDPSASVFGKCQGYTDAACQMPNVGFANGDIYYLEACLFSQICSNRKQLFELDKGDDFQCDLDPDAYAELREWLLAGPEI